MLAVDFESIGQKIAVAIETASGPDNLMIPIPPRPLGVAMAAIVELSIFRLMIFMSLRIMLFGENNQFAHVAFSPAFGFNFRIIF